VAGVFSLHGYAAEPDGPASLINAKDALRIDVQGLVAAKAGGPAARKAQRDALINYYLVPDQNLLWVDENGLTERAKLVMAEIAKADDYGLRASDYALPDPAGFTASDPKARDWLADAGVSSLCRVSDWRQQTP
jgi:hypothetical protein